MMKVFFLVLLYSILMLIMSSNSFPIPSNENFKIFVKSNIYKSASFLTGILSIPKFRYVNNAAEVKNLMEIRGVFSCGYQIPSEFYQSVLSIYASNQISVLPSPSVPNASLSDDAYTILAELERVVKPSLKINCPNIVFGHSRGASASLLAAIMAFNEQNSKRQILSILLDPVDTSDHTLLNYISESRVGNSVMGSTLSVLIIGLPFGGKSRYYNTIFESSCSPSGRNSATIFNTLQQKYGLNKNIHFTYVNLPSFGHLDLLDDVGHSLAFLSVCAANTNLDETKTQLINFLRTVMTYWTLICIQSETLSYDGENVPYFNVMNRTESKFCDIMEYSINLLGTQIRQRFPALISEWATSSP